MSRRNERASGGSGARDARDARRVRGGNETRRAGGRAGRDRTERDERGCKRRGVARRGVARRGVMRLRGRWRAVARTSNGEDAGSPRGRCVGELEGRSRGFARKSEGRRGEEDPRHGDCDWCLLEYPVGLVDGRECMWCSVSRGVIAGIGASSGITTLYQVGHECGLRLCAALRS
jgi:hypothetical protein